MAERDNTKLPNIESTEVTVEDEADSLLEGSNCSRRDSNDAVTGEERRQSEDSVSRDVANFDTRTESVSDQILGEMGSYLEGSPNTREGQGEDAIGNSKQDDHEDILEVQAGVDATIDDQFEVLDSAGDTDNIENLEEVGRSGNEDEKRRSKTKHVTEERSHDKKETREVREKEPDNKGFYIRKQF